ncbi:DUF2513 domain-containing protein [Marinococcus halotolerans]|uniref:DUF2513 domain-containing protein n=1 Tax=Marinococcus halotolerans TaxID=301092 RepID=UPI0003B5A2B5|nr:DUF2513 domain-containing protein [Marinococcus halotolerans]
MVMERDMESIRKLLIDLKEQKPGFSLTSKNEETDYYMYLLTEGGLIEATRHKTLSKQVTSYHNIKITFAGHDFIDVAEDDHIWNKTQEKALEKGWSMSNIPLTVLTDLLKITLYQHLSND